ncbi:unnamed protein product [Arabis nemorensis]|uniref:Uncharacterized protein n=1 Tax=Arabis nemorensis TaxID=586526 RepID=A0A565CHT2_9BRAS|nr:unnamed protein product [Arabis nemorensis]
MAGENCECLSLSQAISNHDLQVLKDFFNRRLVAASVWTDAFETPLRKACLCGQLEVVKELLLHEMTTRPDQTVRDSTYCQILRLDVASGNGNLETVKELYENNHDLLDQEHSCSYGLAIPLVRASNVGHRETTDYLYEKTPLRVLMDDGGYWAICLLLDAVFNGFLVD